MRLRLAVSSSLVSHVVTIVSGLVSVPLFLQAFGRTGYGFWAALLGITSYLSLLNLGVAQTVSSGISRAGQNEAAVAQLVQRGLRFYAKICGIAIPVAGVVALSCPWARWFELGEALQSASRLAAAAVFVTFLLELPFSVFRAALTGSGRVATERSVAVGLLVARVALSWVFSFSHPPLWLAVCALSATNLASYGVAFWFVQRAFPGVLSKGATIHDAAVDSTFHGASRDFFTLQIAGAVVWSTDALLAGLVLDSDHAAQVAAAWRVISIIMALGAVIAPAVSPRLTQLWAAGEKSSSNQLALEAAQIVFALMLVGVLGSAAAGEAIFTLWLGDGMFAGRATWFAYCAIVVVQAVLIIPDAFVTQAAQHARYARFTLLEAILKVSTSVLLMNKLGLVGLPLGTLIGRGLTTLWVLPSAYARATEQNAISWIASVVKPSLAPFAAFALVFLMGTQALGLTGARATFAVGFVAGLVFLGVYVLFGLPRRLRSRFWGKVSSA